MEYVVFTAIVAAGGAMIVWFGIRSCSARAQRRRLAGRLAANGLPEEPVPPVKSVIGGLPEQERLRRNFEDRMDAFQRAYQHRMNGYKGRQDALEGRKYTFVPGRRQGSAATGSA